MKRVPTGRRLRRRLAVTFALVAAISTGALALGTYLVVSNSRLDDSVDASLDQARANLLLAGTVLRGSSAAADVSNLLGFYARRPGFETVALAEGQPFSSTFTLDETQVPGGMRRLVQRGNLAYQRARIDGSAYVVAGGRAPPSRTELYFFFSEEALRSDLAQLRTILLVGWGVVVLLSAAAGALVARRVLRPVGEASAAAHALAEGLLETRLPVDSNDEFGVWAASFNEMAEALEEKIRALSEAQARERRFTADVAHELRTPLTALAGEAALLEEHLDRMPVNARRPTELLVADVGRLRDLVEELLEISRLDAGREDVRPEAVDLHALAARLVELRGWGSSVSLDGEHVTLTTDPRRVERILTNLIENALVHGGRDVTVRIRDDQGEAVIDVADGGHGIPAQHLPHLFERFYKADPSRAMGGSGLGLAIALKNARLLDGTIDAQSDVGAGSRFTLRLPVAEPLRSRREAETRGGDDTES